MTLIHSLPLLWPVMKDQGWVSDGKVWPKTGIGTDTDIYWINIYSTPNKT